MTLDDFLAWEERQDLRYEFDGFQPVAMTGGTYAHDKVATNLAVSLTPRLRGSPCVMHGSNLKVLIESKARYPDALVTCQEYGNNDKLARDPVVIVVIFEVLSPGTDRIDKVREYTALASMQRYVLLEPNRVAATVLERQGAVWITSILTDDAMLPMPEIGIELPLSELYEGVTLTPAAEDDG